jgi:hypothetical protein
MPWLGTKERYFHTSPSRAKQLVPYGESAFSAEKSGRSAATASGEANST